ncbi:MAG: hypothetical protein Q4B86_04255 [Eubacteriales bacterium]|nr:hypothetical protein [Eubacteriales bacterium]
MIFSGFWKRILIAAAFFMMPLFVHDSRAENIKDVKEASDVVINIDEESDQPSYHNKPGVGLKLSYGYNNIAKSGRFLPVNIEIDNYLGSTINGSIILEIPNENDKLMRYVYPVNVEDGKTEDVKGTISISDDVNKINIRLEDEAGLVLAEKESAIKVQGNGAEILIGILSNRPEKLSYFRGVSISNSELKTRTVSLTPGDIPTNEEGLDQLDVIVISDFNVNRLSDEVIEAIWGWVKNGGSLLIGTGNSVESIGRFRAKIKDLEISEAEIRDVNMGIKYSTDGPDGAVIKLPVRDIYIPEGTQVMQSGDTAVMTTVSVESGVIGLTAYSLCDISDFCAEQLGYTDELLQSLMGSSRIKRFSKLNADAQSFISAEQLVNNVDPDRMPMVFFYFLVSISYVLLIGPGLYFFMKYRGVGSYYSFAAIFVSSCAALVLWLLNSSVRFDGPFVNYAMIREITEENVDETGFINISTPVKTNIEIGLSKDSMIQPIVKNATKENETRVSEYPDSSISILRKEDRNIIKAENVKPFSENCFEIYKKSENTGTMPVELTVRLYDEQLVGSIKNLTENDLEDVTLLLYGRLLYIGDIRSGEERKIEGENLLYGPTGSMGLTARYITGLDEAKEGSREYLKALAKTNVLSYYMQESLSSYYPGARVIAFSEENKDLRENNIAESYGISLIVAPVDIDLSQGGEYYRSVLSQEPKIISGDYQADTNTTRGSAAVVLEYSLGTDMELTGLNFHNLSQEFSGRNDEDGSRLMAFQGAKAIYNYSTSTYDLIDSGKLHFTKEELSPYLSPANTINVRYIPDENAEAGINMFLPVLTVTGVEK